MGKKGFRELLTWQKAKDLAVRVYQLSENGHLGSDFWLRDQICRSAVSIASNLAEGDERDTDKEAARFFHIAKGSLAEFRTQIQIACEAGRMKKDIHEALEMECEALGKMLGSLIKTRQSLRLLKR